MYVFFPDYGLLSYTFAGEERWRTPLGPFNNVYGMAASPVLAGDLLILVCDQNRGSFAAGFRQSTGREVWRTARPARSAATRRHRLRPPEGRASRGPRVLPHGTTTRWPRARSSLGERLPGEMKSGPVLVGDVIYINGFSTPDNDPGQTVTVPPFAEVLAKHDLDKTAGWRGRRRR